MGNDLIRVEVAYAKPELQTVIEIELAIDSTVEQAIKASGILQQFPEIDLNRQKVGIFSQACKLDKAVQTGDRIEIYRPLTQNPMSARRNRAQK